MEEFRSLNGIVENGENYSVSNLGNVRNDKFSKILKHRILKNGYHQIGLYKSGKGKSYFIHKLVAFAFLENPDNKSQADHMDRDVNNNSLSNLRWCNRSENQQNTAKRKDCTSKYIGVYWNNCNKKWRAQMSIGGKNKHLGSFVNEIDAAREFDKHVFSDFQTKNFP